MEKFITSYQDLLVEREVIYYVIYFNSYFLYIINSILQINEQYYYQYAKLKTANLSDILDGSVIVCHNTLPKRINLKRNK